MSHPTIFRTTTALVLIGALAAAVSAQTAAEKREIRRTPLVQVVERIAPTVVSINAQIYGKRRYSPWDELFMRGDPNAQGMTLQGQSDGSGVIIHPNGYVVTNDHVVARAGRITVGLSDGRHIEAKVVGTDPQNDIAVLKLSEPGPYVGVELGRSDDLMLGENVIAMGNPFGLEGSVTTGIVSAVKRTIPFNGRTVFEDFIQTSAVINPGNSGGPLLNAVGELIGVNVAIHARGPGIGFAIPVNRIREVVHRVLDPRITKKAWMGFDFDHKNEAPGVAVVAVDSKSPAERAGVRAGDVVRQLNGQPVRDWIDFQARIAELEIGSEAALVVDRNGRHIVIGVPFEEMPLTSNELAVFEWLGFRFGDVADSESKPAANSFGGVVVEDVERGSSAESIGIQKGDIVIAIGDYSIRTAKVAWNVVNALRGKKIETVSVTLIRDGQRLKGVLAVEE